MSAGLCWSCRNPLENYEYGRETNCLKCGKPTRVCRNCLHYARGRPHDCEEPQAEPVADKRHPTMCEFFEIHSRPVSDGQADASADALSAAEALFRREPRA